MTKIRIATDIFTRILAGYEIDKESGEIVLTEKASELLISVVTDKKIKTGRTRKKINDKTEAEMLVAIRNNPNISESQLSRELGYSVHAIHNNERTHAIYLRYVSTFRGNPQFDNDPYANNEED